jgi:hypothetical protein
LQHNSRILFREKQKHQRWHVKLRQQSMQFATEMNMAAVFRPLALALKVKPTHLFLAVDESHSLGAGSADGQLIETNCP